MTQMMYARSGFRYPTQEFKARWMLGESPLTAYEAVVRDRRARLTPNKI